MYDRDNPPRLPASSFKPGDRVFGTDEGGTHHGTVSKDFGPRHSQQGDVLVWFDSGDYNPGALGNLVSAELLTLWPAALHRARAIEAGVYDPGPDVLSALFPSPPLPRTE
jgi:hypothetical protein